MSEHEPDERGEIYELDDPLKRGLFEAGRAAERARVVEWLRESADKRDAKAATFLRGVTAESGAGAKAKAYTVLSAKVHALREAADALERWGDE